MTEAGAEDTPSGCYLVNAGDSVSSIALAHGLSTAAVLARNGLGWRTPIFPGQILRLTLAQTFPDDSSGNSPAESQPEKT
jgi:LysM repeat protein